jgi:hypothetical protein
MIWEKIGLFWKNRIFWEKFGFFGKKLDFFQVSSSSAVGFIKATETWRKKHQKVSISPKMYLKSFAILEKASICLKIYFKSFVVFTKASHF